MFILGSLVGTNTIQNRLLQRSVAWCPSHDDPQTATSAEQCGSDCSSNTKTIRCQTTASEAALATGRAEDYLQDGSAHVQDAEHRNASLPQSSHTVTRLQSCDCVRNLRSSGTPLLARPPWKTDFAVCSFRHSAPAVWNSLPNSA